MAKPEITVPGYRGMDYSDAVECCSMDRRIMLSKLLEEKGPLFADAHLVSTGDTLMLLIENKRNGRREVYDLKIRAHYYETEESEVARVLNNK